MIGVETGASPFNFDTQSGLLLSPQSMSLQAVLFPEDLYIFMLRTTVEAITSKLPCTFDPGSGYYLWNTMTLRTQTVSRLVRFGWFCASESKERANQKA